MLRFVFIFLAVSYFFVRSSFADEALFFGTRQQFMSTRAMGMGNAHVAVADDENAMFFNPAGLRQLKEGKLNLFLKGAVDPDIKDLADEIDKAGSDEDEIAAVLDRHVGDHYSLRAPSLGALYANKRWSVAFIPADVSVDTAVHQGVGPKLDLEAFQDTTLAFGYAWNLHNVKRGKLDIGVTSKLIYRAHLDTIVSIASIQNDKIIEKEDSNEGLTFDFDIGAMWHLPVSRKAFWRYLQPDTLGLVVRNALDYGYFTNLKLYSDDKNGKPEKLHRVVDMGTAYNLPDWSIWKTKFVFDVRDVLHPNWTPKKGVHAGVEFLWEMASWWKGGWRAGINQGYWTAGFTGQIWKFKLDLASYGQELGTESQKRDDRLYMFTTSLDF